MTNALTAYTPNDIMITAKALINSGFLPKSVDSVDKAFAIITLSAELGIGMWQGINGINVISGKPTVSPQLMLALINRSGQLEDMEIDANAERAIVTMTRKGRTPHTETFSMKDAQAMMTTEYTNGSKKTIPLAEKYNWKQMPAIMLKWRAVAACARVVFPDAIMGLYTTEEIAPDAVSLTDDGEAVMIERPAAQSVVIEELNGRVPAKDPQENEQRTFAVARVKRVPVPGGKPVWGLFGVDGTGAEWTISGLESRDMLGGQKGAADGWNATSNAITNLEETILVKATFADGRWWFDEAVGA